MLDPKFDCGNYTSFNVAPDFFGYLNVDTTTTGQSMNKWWHVAGDGRSRSVLFGGVIDDSPEFELFKGNVGKIHGLEFDDGKYYVRYHSEEFEEAWIASFVIENGGMRELWKTNDASENDHSYITITDKYVCKDRLILNKESGDVVLDLKEFDCYAGFSFFFMDGDLYYRQVKNGDADLGYLKCNVQSDGCERVSLGIACFPTLVRGELVIGVGSKGVVAYSLADNALLWEFDLTGFCENLSLVRFCIVGDLLLVMAGSWLNKIELLSGISLASVQYTELPMFVEEMKKKSRAPSYVAHDLVFDGRYVVVCKLNLWGYLLCLSVDDLSPVWCLPSKDIGYSCVAGDYLFTTDNRKHKCLNLATGECLTESNKSSDSNMVMASQDYVVFFNFEGNAEFYRFQNDTLAHPKDLKLGGKSQQS